MFPNKILVLSQPPVATTTALSNTYSLNFGGTDESVNFSANMLGISDYPCTMSAWVKPTHDGCDATGGWIMGFTKTNNVNYGRVGMKMYGTSGSGLASGDNKVISTASWSGYFPSSSDFALTDGEWYFVAVTFVLPTTQTLYVNGSTGNITQVTDSTLQAWSTFDTFCIGIQRGQSSDISPFVGKIDEVAVWDAELTAADLLKIYNDGVPTDLTNAASYDSGDKTGNLVGYWRFEEGSGTGASDSSDTGLNGTLTNMESGDWSTDVVGSGIANNYSILFDGTDDNISGMGNCPTGAFTISAWIKDTTGSSTDYHMIYNAGGELTVMVKEEVGDVQVVVGGNDKKFVTDYDDDTLLADAPIKRNRWHHLVVTYAGGTGGTGIIYVDGTPLSTTSDSELENASATAGIIGASNSAGAANQWTGNIDEFAIFDVVLSADDVTKIYNDGVPTDLALPASYAVDRTGNLLGYWRFEVGSGNPVDSSGNGNTGTLNSAAYSAIAP